MEDKPHLPSAPAEFLRDDSPAGMVHSSTHAGQSHMADRHSSAFPPPFPLQHGQPDGPQHALSPHPAMANHQRPSAFDLGNMVNALPQPAYQAQHYGHRYDGIAMVLPGTTAQVRPAQLGAPSTMGSVPSQQYYIQQHAPVGLFYPNPMSSYSAAALAGPPDPSYFPNHLVVNQPAPPGAQFYRTPASPFSGQSAPVHGPVTLAQYGGPNLHQHPDPRALPPKPGASSAATAQQGNESNGSRQSIVRGPPRKPRQSGHAIWIGNLPPQTDLMSLVHHVCKETDGLESLFLISKSNCAFANFKDEQSCSAAQRKLHDSRFMTVRLVSRLRKSTVEGPAGVTAPTGPAASTSQAGAAQDAGLQGVTECTENGTVAPAQAGSVPEAKAATPSADGASTRKDRFFILKSLTVEDLEQSVRTNTWATQSHNEERLNSAFKTSENVYLVFSANKSGEYFGFARMSSPINDDPAAAIEFEPSAQLATSVDLPKAIPTEPTEFAPKGRIIDDSARGTIFWEADRDDKGAGCGQDDEGSGGSVGGDTGSVRSGLEGSSSGEPRAWGKPFRLEWLSMARLPFYRTRGLKNPWNSNREVKIARDGTELEPSVGRRLIGLFNRAQSPALGMLPGMVPQMVPVGFPPVPPQ